MGANSAYPGNFDNLVTGINGSQRNAPSLADVINKLQQTLGITGAYNFLGATASAGGDLTGNFPNPTLAAIGSATGPIGDGTHVATVTIDAKGRVTALTSTAITGAAPTGAAGGDLSGNFPNPTVVKINGTSLAGLSTGILKNTTATGVPSIAVAGTDYLTPSGNGSALTGITAAQVSALGATASAGGDLSGNYPNPTVAKLNGVAAASYALLASPTFTGTPAAPTAAAGTNTTQLATTAFVQAGAPVNILTTSFTSNAYTLALADANSAQQASNGSTAATVTVPTNASVAFPIGTVITFTQTGTGKIQIAAAGGVTIISSVSGGFVSGTTGCRVQNSTIGLLKTGTNAWTLSGDVG